MNNILRLSIVMNQEAGNASYALYGDSTEDTQRWYEGCLKVWREGGRASSMLMSVAAPSSRVITLAASNGLTAVATNESTTAVTTAPATAASSGIPPSPSAAVMDRESSVDSGTGDITPHPFQAPERASSVTFMSHYQQQLQGLHSSTSDTNDATSNVGTNETNIVKKNGTKKISFA